MTPSRAAGLYALALIPVGGAALVVGGWVMDLSSQAPGLPSSLYEWTLNVVPAFCVGLIGYLALAWWVGAGDADGHSLGGHVRRTAAHYVLVLGLGVLLVHDGPNPDFWSLGQLVFWPWLTAAGGIAGDGLTVLHRRRRRAAAA